MIFSRSNILRPFIFSLLFVAALSSKALHLYQHVGSISGFLFALYFPTFFILEAVLFVGIWFLLQRTSGLKADLGALVAGFLAGVTFIAASSQFAFYFVTGSEVNWDAAVSVGNDVEGRRLMLSGLTPFVCAALILLITAWLFAPGIAGLVTRWWSALSFALSSSESIEELPIYNPGARLRRKLIRLNFVETCTACVVLGTVALWIIRPAVPYNHMSGALPFTLFLALGPHPRAYLQAASQSFPLPGLLTEEFWEAPHDHFKGWAPGIGGLIYGGGDVNARPAWVSESLPPGFHRWTAPLNTDSAEIAGEANTKKNSTNFYNSVTDPLRITNIDRGILEPLARALEDHDIPITHVVMIMMESTRKDVFPFKSGSHLHEEILASYDTNNSTIVEALNAKLSRMTPFAERLTGESSGFPFTVSNYDKAQGELGNNPAGSATGGINIDGVVTSSTFSCKSVLVNHCGVSPLPIDFMGEVKSEIYQPCLMQVLKLFNQLKGDSPPSDATGIPASSLEQIRGRKWKSFFAQSVTGDFGEQMELNTQMGFDSAIYRDDIINTTSPYYHDGMEKVNYFGYPERELYPYLKDAINDAVTNGDRLFLSHFTSSTHHPWGTPQGFQKEQYFEDDVLYAKHKDMNSYLNTVRYVDTWLGEILNLLEETKIANETLVVLVGDHGQAFREDAPTSGTYENGHVSNFRVPLVFHHPLLPRIQVTANATSMSIVPTILDLLVNTKSLNEMDANAALDLINEYEAQSLIRPYKNSHNGRQEWQFGVINPGGTMLSIGSAAFPYRLILPLGSEKQHEFSNLDKDPNELSVIREWGSKALVERVRREYGDEAADWAVDAEKVGKWWVGERKRLWNYHDS